MGSVTAVLRPPDHFTRKHSAPRRLRTIPGVGSFLSLALAVEIGDIS